MCTFLEYKSRWLIDLDSLDINQEKYLKSQIYNANKGNNELMGQAMNLADTVEPLYSTISGVHEMRSCYRRIVVK